MTRFEDALEMIDQNIPLPEKESVSLLSALGCVLAQEVTAPFALPHFDNSAMDGFTFSSEETKNASAEHPCRLKIGGIIKAGASVPRLGSGEAWRIMTGAPIPVGADTVVANERSEVFENELITREAFAKGKNIRYRGEELKRGQSVIPAGAVVNPATIGILASLGKNQVEVYKKPRISVITTGSELVGTGKELLSGRIYDSNSPMVSAALSQMGIRHVFFKRLADSPKKIAQAVARALKLSDFLIFTGGVSTGDTDHVKGVLSTLGVETLFWKVSQKPGKPIYFGKKDRTLVFGLPGNPAAVFTCFYEYVYPAIRRFMGFPEPRLSEKYLPVNEALEGDPDKALFLKAKICPTRKGPVVLSLQGQPSHMISSLHEADALLMIPPKKSFKKGSSACVHLLPYGLDTQP